MSGDKILISAARYTIYLDTNVNHRFEMIHEVCMQLAVQIGAYKVSAGCKQLTIATLNSEKITDFGFHPVFLPV